MKIFTSILFVALAFAALPLHAQQSFEGTMTWSQVPVNDTTPEMVISVKGKKIAFAADMSAIGMGWVRMYNDTAAPKRYIRMPALSKLTHDTSAIEQGGVETIDRKATTIPKKLQGKFKRTEEKATILGYHAEAVTFQDQIASYTMWVSRDVPKMYREAIRFVMEFSNETELAPFEQLIDRGEIPLRITTQMKPETVKQMVDLLPELYKEEELKKPKTFELVRITPGTIDDSIVTPPANMKFQPLKRH